MRRLSLSAKASNRRTNRYRLLAAEADHRLLNNLQSIASVLSLQRRRCPSAEAESQLDSALQRVRSLERVHKALHRQDNAKQIGMKTFLRELCAAYASAFAPERGADFSITAEGDDVLMPSSDAGSLGMAANELLLNAIKYGTGAITVRLSAVGSDCTLIVHNDGPPLRDDVDIEHSPGLGMGIVNAFVQRINGTMTIDRGSPSCGPTFRISFRTHWVLSRDNTFR
jgi:two-component sensor histidine kinase